MEENDFQHKGSKTGHLDARHSKSLRKFFGKKLGLGNTDACSNVGSQGNKSRADRDETTVREAEPADKRDESLGNDLDRPAVTEKEISLLNDKGNEFFEKEEYDPALRMYSEALKLLKRSNIITEANDCTKTQQQDEMSKGLKRFRTARLLVNIGAVHIRREKYDDALSVLDVAMRSSKLVPQESDHYYRACEVMADALENVGLVLFKKKEFEQSSVMYVEALAARRKCIQQLTENFEKRKGPKSKEEVTRYQDETKTCKLEQANTLFYMSLLKERQGLVNDAIHYCEQALSLRREVNKNLKSDSNTLSLLSTIGRLYCNESVRRYDDALAHFYEIHRIRCELVGRNHLDVASSLNNVAFVHMQLEDYMKCVMVSERAIQIATNGRGLNTETCVGWTNKGSAHYYLREYDEALLCFNKALELQTTYLGDCHLMNAGVYEKMADVYASLKNGETAINLLGKSLSIKRKELGQDNEEVARTYSKLGECHLKNGDYSSSVQCHTKSLRIFKHCNNKECAAKEHNRMGGVLRRSGNNNKAMEHYMAALHFSREAKLPSSNPMVSDTIKNVASFQKT